MKILPFCLIFYLCVSYIWPFSYAISEEFYNDHSWLYRIYYAFIVSCSLRARVYCGFILLESSYTIAGLGAYPKELKSRSGHGPSKEVTKEMIESPEIFEYDFEAVKNYDIWQCETTWSSFDILKEWNTTFQYWFAVNVYKQFPIKNLRLIATFITSAYWHGIYLGIYVTYFVFIFVLLLEKTIKDVSRPEQLSPRTFKLYQYFLRFMLNCLKAYCGISYLLIDADKIWFFYNSVYHCGYILFGSLYLICLTALWIRNLKNKYKAE